AAGRVAGNGAAAMPDKSRGATEAVVVPSLAVSRQAGAVVQSHEGDGGVQGQISRSVGRAANKAADLLANLPALPAFRRRKD
ncbi:MAG: ArsR/SmtB family transcription factor, partial [Specibacter sp.]